MDSIDNLTTTPPRPPVMAQNILTPPITPKTPSNALKGPHLAEITNSRSLVLTPPTSPRQSEESNPAEIGLGLSSILSHGDKASSPSQLSAPPISASASIECPFEVEILGDPNGQEQIYGTGAWSTVVKAVARNRETTCQNQTSLSTPPASPITARPKLLAIKRPARRDAIPILKSEAAILYHLARVEDSASHVVPFHGILSDSTSLVLTAIPLSLETHINRAAIDARARKTTWNMSEPIVGSTKTWLDLASQLIEGLAWLHDIAGVVHGDIKPGNILLSPTTHDSNSNSLFPFTLLYADFSSSQLLSSPIPTPNTLSAITREYTAPELLSYSVLSNPCSTATPASDVFSLAVTLLVAATGELLVYGGCSVWQRQAMATQGWGVLANVRGGEEGARLPRLGVVERVLERAVLRVGMGRVRAREWAWVVKDGMGGGPVGFV